LRCLKITITGWTRVEPFKPMTLIHLLQSFAALVSARDTIAVVVLAATFGTSVWAFHRAPSGLRRHRLALGAVALGALVLIAAPRGWLPIPAMACIALAAVGALAWHSFDGQQNGNGHANEEPLPKFVTVLWIGTASILAAIFLFTDLGGYSGSLMVWEPESMRGLVEATKNDVSWPRFTASRLLWGEGLVSTGHDSLLFGSGTYALWKLVDVSPTTLRLMSAFLAAACLPAAYWVGRTIGSRHVATAALVVIAINPVILFYGRYGVSLTATMLAVLLLLGICLRLLVPTQEGWQSGLVAAGAAYLATLAYATGRVVAVAVVMTTLFYGTRRWRRLSRDRRSVFLVMVIVLAALWLFQAASDRSDEFVNVNREHIMTTDPRPEWVEELLGEGADPEHLTLRQRLIMIRKVIAEGLPSLKKVLSYPFNRSTHPWLALGGDPPEFPLVQGPVLLFALWGFSLSLAAWRRCWPLLLVATLAAASLPLLLTNRVDIHRMSLAALPMVVWAAIGLVAASRVMRECRVPAVVRYVMAAVLLALVAADNSTFLFFPQPPQPSRLVLAVQAEIGSIQEPVAVGVAADHRSEGEIELFLLDRQRLDPGDRGELLWQETVTALTEEDGPRGMTIVQIEGMLHDATILLAPRKDFDAAINDLHARGMRARSIGDERTGMWRLDRLPRGAIPAVATTVSPLDLNPRPRRPRATPHQSVRRRLPLTEAVVREVFHGFVPPRFHTAGDGEPITMGGATYGFGIGMHAWTHMLFYPPPGAEALEGVIGLADAVSDCDHALVTFEVWGEDDRRIFDSGPFSAGMAPRHIRIHLGEASTITLALTEAGNGHECDQALWAEPFFTIAANQKR